MQFKIGFYCADLMQCNKLLKEHRIKMKSAMFTLAVLIVLLLQYIDSASKSLKSLHKYHVLCMHEKRNIVIMTYNRYSFTPL